MDLFLKIVYSLIMNFVCFFAGYLACRQVEQSKQSEENQKIIDWFKDTLNIKFTQCKGKGKYRLRMGTKEAKKFCSLILPYMHDSMMYKVIL